MKKFKFIATLIIPIVFIGFLSCEKEDVRTNEDATQTSENILNKSSDRLRIFHNFPTHAYCQNYPGCCLPDIIVEIDEHIISFDNVFATVFEGDDEAIIKVFKEEEKVLKIYIDDDIIDGVINGKLPVEAKPHKDNNDTRFLIFKEKEEGEIFEVDPIVCKE